MATLEQIQTKLKKLQAQAEAMAAKQSSAAISTIRALMEKHGLTVADLAAQAGGKKRGRKPGVSAAVAGQAKPATAAKGKLPPRYRDPKTGATWSGHARPPAWIANVKDRTKFLIDGADVSSAVGAAGTRKPKAADKSAAAGKKATSTRNVSAKAVTAVKKAPAKRAVAAKTPRSTVGAARKKPVARKGPATKAVMVRKAATKAKAPVSTGSDAVKTEA